jgi:hypothetical protein
MINKPRLHSNASGADLFYAFKLWFKRPERAREGIINFYKQIRDARESPSRSFIILTP